MVLAGAGDKKIQVIEEVRALTGLGLKAAKDLVDGAPQRSEKVTEEAADKAKEALGAAGASVEVESFGPRPVRLVLTGRGLGPATAQPRPTSAR